MKKIENNECNQEIILSIYILTYNRAKYLRKCINSVLKQSYENFTVYVLDNHSTDNTKEVVKEFDDERLQYICHEKNIGGVENANFALQHCTSKYMVLFHDDDIMLENFVEKELNYLEEHPECTFVSCYGQRIDEYDNCLESNYMRGETVDVYKNDELLSVFLRRGKTLWFPTLMYRNDDIQMLGIKCNLDVGSCGDIIFYFDILLAGKVGAQLHEQLIKYRIHEGQDSANSLDSMYEMLVRHMRCDKKYSKYLDAHIKEQRKFMRRLTGWRSVMADSQRGNASRKNAFDRVKRYGGYLTCTWYDYCVLYFSIWICSICPGLLKNIYDILRKWKNQYLSI